MLGYKEVGGVYCRHFRVIVPVAGGQPREVHVYKDYVARRLLVIRFGGVQWRFANLTAVPSEAQNPLVPADLDMEAVLRADRACHPPQLLAPPRIIPGLLTHRLDADYT